LSPAILGAAGARTQGLQAGAMAGRAIGLSTMGRLMSADITPKNTESHQTGL
jgi:hypothetical protein